MKNCRTLGTRIFIAICGALFEHQSPIYSDVPRDVEPAQGLIEQILRSEMPQSEQKTNTRPEILLKYDLMQATDDVMKKITAGPEYTAYFQRRKASLSPEQIKSLDSKTRGKWMVEYAQSRADVKPEIKAWLSFVAIPFVPWDQALVDYHRLEKYRPKDIVPVFMLAAKSAGSDRPTTNQWQELIGILRQVLPFATNAEETTDCVTAIAAGATKTSESRDGQAVPIQMIWSWMRELQLPKEATPPDTALRFYLAKMNLAMAAKDYMAAAELAPDCRLRIFQPMWLVCAGKQKEAYEILAKLRQDVTLTELEKVGLRKLAPLILMFAHKFEEAHKALDAIRQSRNLTVEDLNWVETMKGILGNLETAARLRGNNKQP